MNLPSFTRRAAASALLALAGAASAGPIGYTAWDVSGSDILLRMDLTTGQGTSIGSGMGFSDVDGLAFDRQGGLWAVDDNTNRLLRIDTTTGVGTAVGSGFGSGYNDMGLAFGADGTLFMASTNGSSDGRLYTVNTTTGSATLVGDFDTSSNLRVRSLAFANGVLYGWSNVDTLLNINTSTGQATTIGGFGFASETIGHDGMDADPLTGWLWALSEVENRTYTLDATTGAATVVATSLWCDGAACYDRGSFTGLAISAVPEPGTLALSLLGLAAVVRRRRAVTA